MPDADDPMAAFGVWRVKFQTVHCGRVDLWQVPTSISAMCYYIPTVDGSGVRKDPCWENIRYRYIQ
ncbi:MAG: hypothetical protein H7831_17970, partial [Magnetococcus sp. WYHC-3]